jgi:cytochrome c553
MGAMRLLWTEGRIGFGCLYVAVAFFVGQTAAARAAPDIELGRYLANQCLTCHRATNVGGIAIPKIFGVAEPKLVSQLKAYRDKTLPNDVMQAQAAGLKDDEIEALAAYFSRTKGP